MAHSKGVRKDRVGARTAPAGQKPVPIYASRKLPATGASADPADQVALRWALTVAGARPNDGSGSTLVGRVGVVSENIRAASHVVGSQPPPFSETVLSLN